LKIGRLCKEFGCLPWAGGLLQQPKGAVLRLEAVMDASARYEEMVLESQKIGKE
jgi:hypothetical protein